MLLRFSNSNPDKVCKADTAIVTNGKFYFKGLPEDNFLSIVTIGNYPEKVLAADVFLEEGTINLNLDSISHRSGTLHGEDIMRCVQRITPVTQHFLMHVIVMVC